MFESLDIFILAIVAGFIIYKLYNILGQGDEEYLSKHASKRKIVDIFPIDTMNNDLDVDIKIEEELNLKDDLRRTINEIKLIDRNFNEHKFIDGATKAFEMILKAYSEADKETLKKLLSKEVFKDFWSDVETRRKNGEFIDKTLVTIVSSEIVAVNLDNKKIANISVKFVSQQINLVKDEQGKIIKGDPSEIDNMSEIWTFSKSITVSNPFWKLIETKSE